MVPLHLPIFPLPDLTFFPHTHLPLHVFEARYRALVTDALGRDRLLAVVGLQPGYEADYHGKPAVVRVAGAGEIVEWERLATGRFNILVRGDRRIRIERELATDTLYRMVRARPLADTNEESPEAGERAARIRAQCRELLAAVGRAPDELDQALATTTSPGALGDRVAAAVVPSAPVRQALLEELDVERRLALLVQVLDHLLQRFRRGG